MPRCGAVLGGTPEDHRRVSGVSGRPEYPVLGDRSLRSCPLHRQSLRGPAGSPATTEYPVAPTGVSGPPPMANVWCGTGVSSGGTPEGVRSLRPAPESPACTGVSGPLTPESPVQEMPNGQIFQRGINTPPPTSNQLARPAFMNLSQQWNTGFP